MPGGRLSPITRVRTTSRRASGRRRDPLAYIPGDPFFEHDPIFQSVRDTEAQRRMIPTFDLETTRPEWALGYRFDIVLEGRNATPMEKRR